MAWMKIDDRVRTHPKVVRAGPAAAWFWFCGICYCREHLTDGFIPTGMLPSLAPGVTNGRSLARKLVEVHLWHEAPGGYQVHDFTDWNLTRAEVEVRRRLDSGRKKRGIPPDDETPSSRNTDGSPDGIREDSSRAQAAAQGSVSSSSPESLRSSEEGLGETAGGGALIHGPGRWGRVHSGHVTGFCDWLCLPDFIFDGFIRRVMATGTLEAEARTHVLAWAHKVRESWADQGIPGDDELRFWRHEWQRTHGSNRPSATPPRAAGLDAIIRGGRRG